MNTRVMRFVLPGVMAVVVAAAACGGSKKSGESTNAAIEGSWKYTGGTFLGQDASVIGTLTYLDFSRSGAGTLFARMPFAGVVGCADLLVAVVNESVLTMQIPALVNSPDESTTFYFNYARSGSTLTITDTLGASATFEKVDAVPATAQCLAPTGTTAIPLSLPPDSSGGIGSDGTKLYWTDSTDTQWVTFDPVTLTSSAVAIPFTAPAGLVRAVQGPNDLWVDCYCGANESIWRVGVSGTSMDQVDTSAAPINSMIVIRAGTFNAGHLWLAGDSALGDFTGGKILKIDSAAEPDTLTASFILEVLPQGITFRGTRLFILTNYLGTVLAELDPSIGTAIASWRLPSHYYGGGLAAVGDTLYVVNQDDDSLLAVDVP